MIHPDITQEARPARLTSPTTRQLRSRYERLADRLEDPMANMTRDEVEGLSAEVDMVASLLDEREGCGEVAK